MIKFLQTTVDSVPESSNNGDVPTGKRTLSYDEENSKSQIKEIVPEGGFRASISL